MFDIVWKDYIQEEARVANREALLREDDQDLATHTKEINQSNIKTSNQRHSKKKSRKGRRRITQSINATIVIR